MSEIALVFARFSCHFRHLIGDGGHFGPIRWPVSVKISLDKTPLRVPDFPLSGLHSAHLLRAVFARVSEHGRHFGEGEAQLVSGALEVSGIHHSSMYGRAASLGISRRETMPLMMFRKSSKI